MTAAAMEGEVIEPTSRRIERNAARTPEVLPPDVDTKVVALSRLDSPELQTRAVTTMLNHARTGLLAAIAAQDLPQIVAFKQKAAAIQEIAKQVRLGKDMQLDAAEFVRRAERGLGIAIRDGQERGEIVKTGDIGGGGNGGENAAASRNLGRKDLGRPTDFAGPNELHGQQGIYALTDSVSDEKFEGALTEAREEGNLSRANVARKCKAKAYPRKEAIDADDPLIDAEVVISTPASARPFKKSDTEMLAEIVGSLANFADLMRYIRADQIEKKQAILLTDQAASAIGLIRKSLKEIRHDKA